MDGILNIYKEQGFTSHDVVAKLRGILKQKKIGHTGTLDPDAVGVLPVCLGKATKVCDILTDKNKTYEVVLKLGIVTDTQDMTGTVLEEHSVTSTKEEIEQAVFSFVGSYAQIPPMYSALKVNGKKLYELAREGKEVERKAREVSIFSIQIQEIDMDAATIKMSVDCSKGTYIRTLCHDIGKKLGCGGVMASLKRTKVSFFVLQESITLSEVESFVKDGTIETHVIKVDSLFESLEAVVVKAEFQKYVDNGNKLLVSQLSSETVLEREKEYRVYDAKKRFIGIFEAENCKSLKPKKMFI